MEKTHTVMLSTWNTLTCYLNVYITSPSENHKSEGLNLQHGLFQMLNYYERTLALLKILFFVNDRCLDVDYSHHTVAFMYNTLKHFLKMM